MSSDGKKPVGRIQLKRRAAPSEGASRPSTLSPDSAPPEDTSVLRTLSKTFGVPGVDLNRLALDLSLLRFVPREVAEASQVLPVKADETRLFLAMASPNDRRVIDELEFVIGQNVVPYVAPAAELERVIRAAYDANERHEPMYFGPLAGGDAKKSDGSQGTDAKQEASAETLSPSLVVPTAVEASSAKVRWSTADFGAVSEEVSNVDLLPRDQNHTSETVSSSGKCILIVDDEAALRALARRVMIAEGHAVMEADRGQTALRALKLKERTPDLILLDAMLPEVHGFDIARRIKGSAKYGAIPILMMSAAYRGAHVIEDIKAKYGIDDYLEKPFTIEDLVARVTALLDRPVPSAGRSDPDAIDREAATLLAQGIAAYKAGEVDLAIEHLRKGIATDPLAYRLRYHLALIYGKRGQFYDGIAELERAVDLNGRHFPALKNLAVLYEKAGFNHKAVEMWKRCAKHAPDDETRRSVEDHLATLVGG
jgi:DNA-binding response OmpR family regulator